MSDITNDFVNKLYSENGKQLTPEKLEYIKSNYSTNEEFEKVFLKTVSLSSESRVAEVEKKNPVSTITSEETPSESPIQEPKKNTLLVGGNPVQTGDSASSAGKGKSVFGEPVNTFQENVIADKNAKDKEKKKKKPKEQKLKKVEIEKENAFGPTIQSPIEEIVQSNIKASKDAKITSKIPVSTNQVVNNAYDYAVKNLDTSITEQKYEDEVNESQFMDGVKNGLINLYNTKIGIPLSSIADKNFLINKSKPLEDQYEEIAKIEKKEGVSYSPDKKAKMAKEMFIEQENKNQMYTLIDKALPSGYDREGVWKDLKLQSIRSNDQLRSTIASAEVFKGKITQFNDFFKGISTSTTKGLKGPGVDALEETQEGYVFDYNGQKITLSPKQYQEFEKLKADAIDAQAKLKSMSSDIDRMYKKAKKDDELIDLFKYNYNDFDATVDQVLGGFGEAIGGSLKLLGESSNYIEQKTGFTPRLTMIAGTADAAIKTGNALLDVSEDATSQYLRYNISDLSWKNLPSFSRQLFSEQLPIILSIYAGGPGGMAVVSAGSGGRLFRDLEKQEQLPFGRKYSLGEKLTAAWLYAGAEYGGEYFGTGLLLRGFKNTIKNGSLPARKLYFEGLIDAGKKFVRKTGTGSFIESSSEGATGAIQIGVDLGVLGKDVKSKEAFERMYESIGTGGFMGFGMASVGSNIQFMVSQAKVFATREENRKISKILTDIEALSQELNNNPLLSDDDKSIIKADIETKADEANEIITKNANKDKDFSVSEKAELLSISASQIDLREQYEAINKSNINSDLKKQKISDLNKKFDALEKKRAEIIKGTFEPFNYLPEEEKTVLKVEAATILKQDALDGGTKEEDINIPADLIEKKAKGLYNQKIQQKNEKSTGKTNTEEKPTGINAEQTTSATQQKDGVQLQSQEEIDNNKLIGLEPNGGVDANVDMAETYSGNKFEITLSNVDENGNALPRGDGKKKIVIRTISSDGTVTVNNALTKTFETAAEAKEYANKFIEKDSKPKSTPESIIEDQQKDKNTNVKKEVDKLRAEEIKELTDNVENPEGFITDGKVDANKIAESDNAKAKEIYAKYDKLLKPLLNNIKTQEVVVEKPIEERQKEAESKIKRKDLFIGVGEFSTELGGSDKAAVPVSHNENNGIEIVEYAHPDTGSIDVVVTGKSEHDFVGFYRIYENGKPTDKWSSKFENQSRNKEDFKTMISSVQDLLPEGHKYTEKTSISTDGLRVWAKQLDKGYELQYDENGNVVTSKVFINGDAIENVLGVDVNKGKFESIRATKEEFESIKKALTPYMEKFGLGAENIKLGIGINVPGAKGLVTIDLPVLTKSKTQENAIQKQSTNEGVLQPEQSKMGLQEVEQGDQVDKKPTEQGEEKIDVDIFSEVEGKDLTDKTTYDKVYDFLTKVENDLSDIQDNTLTAQGLPIAVVKAAIKAMKLAMEAGKTASEVLKNGMDSLKNSDWYSKKSDVEKSNLEPVIGGLLVESSIREEGRMIAKSKAKDALKSLFKMVGKANKNVLAGKAGKLTGIASKILGLTSLNPKSVRKVVDDGLYSQYVSAISRLSGRNLTIEDTNIKRYDAVYDKIVKAYEEFERKKSEIQNKIDAGIALDESEQEFYNKNKSDFSQKDTDTIDKTKDNEEKRGEVIDEILDLKPLLAQAFKGTSAPKGSKTFDYLKAVSEIKISDLESMSDSMLNNTLNALNSIANDGVSVSYLEKIYSHIMSEDVANAAKKASKVAGKTGLYKYKLPRFFLNTTERLSSLITKGVTQKKDIILKRIFEFRGNRIDDAVKNYGESYLYNSIMSILAKNLSSYSAVNERALEKIKNAEKELIKSLSFKDSVSESFFKISFYLIDSMAKSNPGTTSSVDAIKYFIETAKLESTNYGEDVIDKLQKFINKIENGELIDEFGNVKLTEAEKNAANVISDVLINNQDRAYEGRFFQNANSSPLIVNYHPVTNNSSTSIKDVMEVINAFLTTSTISGNLMEKTGTAHPINVNPFSNAMSSIMNTNLQYFLRTEVMAISKGIDKAIAEATDVNEKRYLIGIRDGVKAFIDEVIAGNSVISSKLDNVLDSLKSITNRVLLSNEIRAAAEFATNSPVLFVDGAEMLIEGRKLVGKLKELSKDNDEIIFNFLTNVEASQIPRLLEKIKSTSERAEYSRKGVGTEYLSKTIPMSTTNAKFDNFVKNNNLVDGVKEYNNFVMSGSDNFSAFIYWFGKFNDEFKKIYGEAIDVDGASDSNSDYLKDKNVLDAIKRASNIANDQTTELFGSTNKFEKQLDIMASSATGKAKNALLNIAKETVNFMNQFQMGVVEAMRSNVNRGVENKDAREARKFVLQGVRTTGYTISALAIITELLSYLIPEDDDEKKLKDSLGNLRDDEELIKEVNKYMSIMDPKKEDEDVELSEEDALFKEQFLDKMMKNDDFVKAYKSYIGFMNRDILQRTIEAAADAINKKVIRFEKDSFDNVMNSINDGDTDLLSKDDLVYSLGFLNSEQGRSAFNSEKRNDLFNKIEEVIDEKEVFYSLDSREKMNYLDVQAMHNTVALLYNHRKMDLNDMYLKEGAKAGLDFFIGRKNNLVRAAVHYGAEQINKARIEAKYGAYDYKKDAVFRPITSYKIDDNLKDKSLIRTVFKDLGKAILPAYVNLPNTISGSDMSIAKFAGIPLSNSLDRLYRKNKQDELKLETVSKFQKNYLIESNESKEAVEFAFDFFGLKNEEKDETIQTSIVPGKQGDKGNVEKKSKRSGIGGGKDLKVNGNRAQ